MFYFWNEDGNGHIKRGLWIYCLDAVRLKMLVDFKKYIKQILVKKGGGIVVKFKPCAPPDKGGAPPQSEGIVFLLSIWTDLPLSEAGK